MVEDIINKSSPKVKEDFDSQLKLDEVNSKIQFDEEDPKNYDEFSDDSDSEPETSNVKKEEEKAVYLEDKFALKE